MATSKERALALTLAVMHYFVKKRYAVNVEIGLDKRGIFRADVLCMTIYGYLVIGEVKQSVADFRADTKRQKWHNYLRYSNKLYFVFPHDVWLKVKGEVPAGIGVFVLSPKTGKVYVAQRAKHRDLEKGVQKILVLRMAYRGAEFSKRNIKRMVPQFIK
jgi:hypothetical protein